MKKTIYDLGLHESLHFSTEIGNSPLRVHVLRVAGGWIYSYFEVETLKCTEFVPYSTEFKQTTDNSPENSN